VSQKRTRTKPALGRRLEDISSRSSVSSFAVNICEQQSLSVAWRAWSWQAPNARKRRKVTVMTALANDVRRVSSADGAIVLHLRRGTMFRINPTGALILDLLEQGATPTQIAERIRSERDIALEVVQSDLQAFLDSLQSLEVLACTTREFRTDQEDIDGEPTTTRK
jgi:hypothetical protein